MRFYIPISLLLGGILLGGCSGSTTTTDTEGWHFQGRDCMACHNVDLATDKNLFIGGTLFKSATVTNKDDLAEVCGGKLLVNFLDSSYNTVYSSKDYAGSTKGDLGKGNLYILDRQHTPIEGNYYMQITDANNTVLAVSSTLHSFNGVAYDAKNSTDTTNRNACNACHTQISPLFVQANQNLCQ